MRNCEDADFLRWQRSTIVCAAKSERAGARHYFFYRVNKNNLADMQEDDRS